MFHKWWFCDVPHARTSFETASALLRRPRDMPAAVNSSASAAGSGTDADSDWSRIVMRARPLELRLGDAVERGEQRVGFQSEVDVDVVAVEELALHRHQSGRQLGVTDVDRQYDVAGLSQLGGPSR